MTYSLVEDGEFVYIPHCIVYGLNEGKCFPEDAGKVEC